MGESHDKSYDVAIIGAGLSGLVCGCYLAKAGLKVLIAEQHSKPGGYCTSFSRQGFTFDAAAHSIGGFKYGNLGHIFNELGLNQKVSIERCDPSSMVITPDHEITFWSDLQETVRGLQNAFPHESNNIAKLFSFLFTQDPTSSVSTKSLTFQSLLDRYLKDGKLKAILSYPLFGNSGLPPSLLSAFIGVKIFREFVLDGGYYPDTCMQALPDALVERFKESGGKLLLSRRVKKIIMTDNRVAGAVLEKEGFIASRYVVSNCDARQTFSRLLGGNLIDADFTKRLSKMKATLSAFVLYLGIDENLPVSSERNINKWIMYHYDLDRMYLAAKRGKFDDIGGYLLYISPVRRNIVAYMRAPFKNRAYWMRSKDKLTDEFVQRIEKDGVRGLSQNIKYRDSATPHTLHRYTLNHRGAAFGWESSLSQLAVSDFRKPSFVRGLYLTGHWTTKGLGIPGVFYIGQDTAKMILRKEGMKII